VSDATNQIELALLTRVIYDRDFHGLEKAQITEEFFQTPLAKEVYRFMRAMYHAPATAGQVPSLELIQMHFPQSFYPFPSNDTVSVLSAELRRQKVRIETLILAQNISELAERDPMAAMASLKAEVSKISALAEVGQDMTLAGAYQHLLNNYETVQSSHGVIGIPYPWEAVNVETQGMQGGQFIVLYARPKSMKTWLGLYMAMHAYKTSRRRVLVYSREMSPKLVAQRAAALFCEVDYRAFKNGTLQPHMKQMVFTKLQEMIDDEKSAGQYMGHQPYFKIISDSGGGGGGGGVSWLHAKVKEAKPDLVVVDGMYLMKDDRTSSRNVDWKNITHISQDLKRMAQDEDIPVIGITQANRGSEKEKEQSLSGLAYSDSLAQDADAAFHVGKRDRVDEATKKIITELYLTAPGLREGKFEGIVIRGEPATDFSYLRTLTSADFDGDYEKAQKRSQFQRPAADPTLPTRAKFGR
jgi:replicative DNA helicase